MKTHQGNTKSGPYSETNDYDIFLQKNCNLMNLKLVPYNKLA